MENQDDFQPDSSRGTKTREQLLAFGLEAFARYGPEGVTTRQLAKMAGVNSAAIAYYFGGKDGYYLAVVKHLLEELGQSVLVNLPELMNELERVKSDRQAAGKLLALLIRRFAITILTNPKARYMAAISSREHLHPTPAYDILYTSAIRHVHGALTQLVAAATGSSPDSPETLIRAHAVLGQVLLFRVGATTLCRRLGWDTIDQSRAEQIAAIVSEMACRSLGLEVPQA